MSLGNFYDFQDMRDVTRYKTRLQEGLLSIDSTRLPTVTVQKQAKEAGRID